MINNDHFRHPQRAMRASGICMFFAITILSQACTLEERKSSGLRGHTEKYFDVEHGFAAQKGPRYCQYCHGATLAGGKNGEPSCYQCHGLNWLEEIDPEKSLAPEDHTKVNDIYAHHPRLESPNGFCTNCHGAELQGDKTRQSPSCYLCHGELWE